MKKIVVTGANGQLGNELRAIDRSGTYATRYRFVFTDVAELDITDRAAVGAFMEEQRPDWIINAAAYTAVDRAESDADRAELLNAGAVANLVTGAGAVGAGFVQVSTDYVFDGRMPEDRRPWSETDPTGPRSVYGATKLRGEQAALAYGRSFVVRTAWLYSTYGNNFVKTMLRLGAERSELGVVADQWGTPTYAADLAAALMRMVARVDELPAEEAAPLFGLYHYTDDGVATWYDLASETMRLGGRACTVRPITTAEYPTPAERPAWSVLSKAKIKAAFGVEVPDWRESLARCIEAL
ncbi:dTDP-4-dehydrorhamnose reductase [Millionella massiliensis]|uniref:dTDP-4-dehydrorhamnose reductase n=1 Tax=Millionella massiliensis TaxID=1871023 RepID=UPI0023A8D70D|nr:dTDP-4-dehydrorhamnose reductase [Millionella massiliensis]